VDIGGESTRPGATRIDAAEQIRRTVPVIAAIRRELAAGPVITIDTTLAEVARAALDVGADAINDVSAGTEDPGILVLAAQRRCGLILMHRLAPPGRDVFSHQYAAPPDYSASGGVTGAVVAFLQERIAAASQAGVSPEAIVVDPGLGFGKTVEQNLELIRGTPALCELGRPVLSGVSRKSFTAKAAGIDTVRHPRERVHASVGLSVAHLFCGATIFRVHDVREHVEALRAAWAARDQSGPAGTPTA
jgi:dihydropteroate synthase